MYKYVRMFKYKHVYVHVCFCIIKQIRKYYMDTYSYMLIGTLECKITCECVSKHKYMRGHVLRLEKHVMLENNLKFIFFYVCYVFIMVIQKYEFIYERICLCKA